MRTTSAAQAALRHVATALGVLGAAGLVAGCISSKRHLTDTERSATEQLLVTTATERAVEELTWPALQGRRVAVQVVSPSADAQDADYLRAALEARARALGARVVPEAEADWILATRAGALGTERRELALGVPEIPTPFGITPGISFYTNLRQRGWAKLRLEVRDGAGGTVSASEPVLAGAFRSIHRILVFVIDRSDIFEPEPGG